MAPRSSGILLHPTSLPGPFGVGTFGREARAFVDFLRAAGQSWWQVLPLHPTGYGNSPYQSLSAFAGNTLLIDPRQMIDDDLLELADLTGPAATEERANFEAGRQSRDHTLGKAFESFTSKESHRLRHDFDAFCKDSSWWLDDYALFGALKQASGGSAWTGWNQELAVREPNALAKARDQLAGEITAHKFFQFLFFRQWKSLRDYGRERGVGIIGDVPIFVAHDSADVWVHREYFKLDEDGRPIVVAGVPPDYFSETGQLWGNPLYDWGRLRADGFKWWIDRLRFALEQFDFLRVDHFRGFAACWEIPAGKKTARKGQWIKTPGRELFSALTLALGKLPIIAENLGVITPDVEDLRKAFGFPGMRVLQFAFGSDSANDHLPSNYRRNTVVYTGTHDNDTTKGWFASLSQKERESCLQYLNSDGKEIHWDLIRAALASIADTAIIPMQDVLGLGQEARMNLPASKTDNWTWRMATDALTDQSSRRLRETTELYGRLSRPMVP